MLLVRTSFLATMLALLAPALRAESPVADNIWHRLTENSPLFLDETRDYHGAGLVQEDGLAAVLLLGNDSPGAVVTLRLPGWTEPQGLVSRLDMPGGYLLDRTVSPDQMRIQASADGSAIELSFAVSADDIRLFRKGLRWRIVAGSREAVFTLKGSNKAISAAMNAKSRGPVEAQTSETGTALTEEPA